MEAITDRDVVTVCVGLLALIVIGVLLDEIRALTGGRR